MAVTTFQTSAGLPLISTTSPATLFPSTGAPSSPSPTLSSTLQSPTLPSSALPSFSSPQVQYPANKSDGYLFNSIDLVNVSCSWSSPPSSSSVDLFLWLRGIGQSEFSQGRLFGPCSALCSSNNRFPSLDIVLSKEFTDLEVDSYIVSPLNVLGITYPASGYYQLLAVPTGNISYSVNITITPKNGVSPRCFNCTSQSSSSGASLSSSTSTTVTTLSHVLGGGLIAGIVICGLVAMVIGGALV